MKRIVAFLAAVCVSGVCLAASVRAQDTPPPPPTDASGDTLRTKQPAKGQTTEAEDSTAALNKRARAQRMREADENRMAYIFSLGIGTGIEYKPDELANNYSPLLGLMLAGGVRQHGVTVALNIGYNFFLANSIAPND